MPEKYQEFEACTLCGSHNLSTLQGYAKAYLCKCINCNFVFVKRIPTDAELQEHYSRYPRSFDISPITLKRYNELLNYFEKFKKTNRLMDIGSGNCLFLLEAKKRGWQVYGSDYEKNAVAIGEKNGIVMKHGKLDANWFDSGFFDVITSFETIEHVNEPNHMIQQINLLLRKGGVVYLTTPNFGSIERYYLKADYNVIEYPEHLSYFSKGTMQKLLTQNGFEKLSLQTTGISLTRLKTSWQRKNKKPVTELYTSNENTDEKIRNKIETNIFAQVSKKVINSLLTFAGTGNSIKATFIKK
ncbi:MAG: class I SAM-dependent methyltransferase [Bacteroidetes bacterium]|nr:class I SAM-dependent methyltransferase [Bacteroidota bacterium]